MKYIIIVYLLPQVCQFSYCGEKLTTRLRCLAFTTMLQQEIGWFDEKANQVGALTSRLVNDASMVKGVRIYCNFLYKA
jgi:ATP-binding cassette subfamily B (MDR/TAP) protein 1